MNFVRVLETTEETIRRDFGVSPIYDPILDQHFWIWDDLFSYDENNKPNPSLSVQECAKFFARGPWWLRWKYRKTPESPQGGFVLNGIEIVPKRTDRGNRYYTLADVERMAHALAKSRAISGEKLAQVMTLLLIQGAMYGVFDKPRKS